MNTTTVRSTDPDRLVELATELVMRVREVEPTRNGSWLQSLTDDERWGLLFTLAAMVDPDVNTHAALGWTFPLADAADQIARERWQ